MSRVSSSGVLRSPLVRFLVLGLAIFGLVALLDRDGGDADRRGDAVSDRKIHVERDALLAFVQRRTREADAAALRLRFDSLDARARQDWIDRFVQEEALVREARRLGLDRDDELIRRRLVEKMEFLLADGGGALAEGGEAMIARLYRERVEAYRVPGVVTFAHAFVRDLDVAKGSGSEAGRSRAEALRRELERDRVSFGDVGARGDRFLYQRRYVGRTLEEIESHFGSIFAEAIIGLEPDATTWQGPVVSNHGWHVVLITAREPSRLPSLAEIEATLRRDLAREQTEKALEEALGGVVDGYRIEFGRGLSR